MSWIRLLVSTAIFLHFALGTICPPDRNPLYTLHNNETTIASLRNCIATCSKTNCSGILIRSDSCISLNIEDYFGELHPETFVKKVCMPDLPAPTVAHDLPAHTLLGSTEKLSNAEDKIDCLLQCASETTFACKSIMFYEDVHDCLLNSEDSHGAMVTNETDGFSVSYMELEQRRVLLESVDCHHTGALTSMRLVPHSKSIDIHGETLLYNGTTGLDACLQKCGNTCDYVLFNEVYSECFIVQSDPSSQLLNFIDSEYLVMENLCRSKTEQCTNRNSLYIVQSGIEEKIKEECVRMCMSSPDCLFAYSVDGHCVPSAKPLQLQRVLQRKCAGLPPNDYGILFEQSEICVHGPSLKVENIDLTHCLALCVTHPTQSCEAVAYYPDTSQCSLINGDTQNVQQPTMEKCHYYTLNIVTNDLSIIGDLTEEEDSSGAMPVSYPVEKTTDKAERAQRKRGDKKKGDSRKKKEEINHKKKTKKLARVKQLSREGKEGSKLAVYSKTSQKLAKPTKYGQDARKLTVSGTTQNDEGPMQLQRDGNHEPKHTVYTTTQKIDGVKNEQTQLNNLHGKTSQNVAREKQLTRFEKYAPNTEKGRAIHEVAGVKQLSRETQVYTVNGKTTMVLRKIDLPMSPRKSNIDFSAQGDIDFPPKHQPTTAVDNLDTVYDQIEIPEVLKKSRKYSESREEVGDATILKKTGRSRAHHSSTVIDIDSVPIQGDFDATVLKKSGKSRAHHSGTVIDIDSVPIQGDFDATVLKKIGRTRTQHGDTVIDISSEPIQGDLDTVDVDQEEQGQISEEKIWKSIELEKEDDLQITVHPECTYGSVKIKVFSNRPFKGEIFPRNQHTNCTIAIDGTEAELVMNFGDENCILERTPDNIYKAVIVVKKNRMQSPVITETDSLFHIGCQYNGNVTVLAKANPLRMSYPSFSHLSVGGKVSTKGVREMQLRTSQDEQAETVHIGQPLELMFSDAQLESGYRVRRCTARDPRGNETLTVIEEGCPAPGAESFILRGPIKYKKGGFTIPFRAFKFNSGENVRLRCKIEICGADEMCVKPRCTKNGQFRRRRETDDEEAERKTETLHLDMIVKEQVNETSAYCVTKQFLITIGTILLLVFGSEVLTLLVMARRGKSKSN